MKFFVLEDLSHIIICLSRNNCIGKSMEKEKTITEHVQFLNQINLSETRYAYFSHKGRIICYCCRGYGVLELNIEFEGFAYHNMYLMQKKKIE